METNPLVQFAQIWLIAISTILFQNRIGALIGKNGANIKKLQADTKCKIIVKTYPVESGEQYISIEGEFYSSQVHSQNIHDRGGPFILKKYCNFWQWILVVLDETKTSI